MINNTTFENESRNDLFNLDRVTIPNNYHLVGFLIALIVILVGLFGNVLILVSIATTKKLRKTQNIYAASMAIVDLCFNVFIVGVHSHFFLIEKYNYGPAMCWYITIALMYLSFVIALHVPVVAIQRYLAVVHPSLRARVDVHSPKFILGTIGAIHAIIICVVIVPRIEYFVDEELYNSIYFTVKVLSCTVPSLKRGSTLFMVAAFLVCVITIVFCYCSIINTIRKSQNKIRVKSVKSDTKSPKSMKTDLKLLQVMLVIFALFFIGFIGIPLISLFDPKAELHFSVYFPMFVLLWTTSCNNWIVYGVMNKEFRDAFKTKFGIKIKIEEENTSTTQTGHV